jgi:DNA (cytosine-5)-methyltransferase 1
MRELSLIQHAKQVKKWNYYNEFDPKAAAWIRELIKQKLIPEGEVDERSITEVSPEDVKGFIQAHWFAGICGWSLALQLAGWPADRPVWTGSCPCQPFSAAGKGAGGKDERHLWPAFFNLIREHHPEYVFGEQVASAIGHGWLDGISADLESEDYACGAAVLGAHSVGAPHIRQRLFWVADAGGERLGGIDQPDGQATEGRVETHIRCATDGMADAASIARAQHVGEPGEGLRREAGPCNGAERGGDSSGMAESESEQPHGPGDARRGWGEFTDRGGMGDTPGRGRGIIGDEAQPGSSGHLDCAGIDCGLGISNGTGRGAWEPSTAPAGHGDTAQPAGFWDDSYWHFCRDGKHRRIPTFPIFQLVADGLSAIMGRRWDDLTAAIKERIEHHATNSQTSPGEILRKMLNQNGAEANEWETGGSDGFLKKAVLFAALLKLAGEVGRFKEGTLQGVHQVENRQVRTLRQNPARLATTPRSPQGLQLEKQCQDEFTNLVHELSHEDSQFREAELLAASFSGFPLASSLPYRVGKRGSIRPALLKGAGNAIVPPLAAEFIRAFLDINQPRPACEPEPEGVAGAAGLGATKKP